MGGRLEQIKDAADSTFDWVWKTQGFEAWLKSGGGIYWIVGKPGSGKSTMMKYLSSHPRTFDTLSDLSAKIRGARSMIAVHCFDYGIAGDSPLNRSLDGMVRSLLSQIIVQAPILGQHVINAFDEMKRRQSSLQWSTFKLQQLLLRLIEAASDHPLCVFIDALDECEGASDSGSGTSIAEWIYSISQVMQQRGRLCLSSRSSEFSYELRTTPKFVMDRHTAADISTYVNAKLRPMLDDEGSSYDDGLAKQLVSQANGGFLWVRLAAEMLLKSWIRRDSFGKLKKRLNELPRNLTNLYKGLFEDMSVDDREEAHLLLGLVASSKAPLTVANVSDVLHLLGYETALDYSTRIQTVCLGLLDVRNRIVRPSHQTVLEYLKQKLPGAMQRGNSLLLEACLIQCARHDRPTKTSFARYAILHWPAHARRNLDQDAAVNSTPLRNLDFLRWYEAFLTISDPMSNIEASPSGEYERRDKGGCLIDIAARRLLEILLFHSVNRSIARHNLVVLPIGEEDHNPRWILHDVGSGLDLRVALDVYSRSFRGSALLGVSNEFVMTRMDWTLPDIKARAETQTDLFQAYLEAGSDSLDSTRIVERHWSTEEPNIDAPVPLGIWMYAPEEFCDIVDFLVVSRRRRTYRIGVAGRITPLQLACWLGMIKTVRLMLENGADPNLATEGSAFGTPLLACIQGQWEKPDCMLSPRPFRLNCMVLLLEAGADPNQQGLGTSFEIPISPTDLAVARWAADLKRESD